MTNEQYIVEFGITQDVTGASRVAIAFKNQETGHARFSLTIDGTAARRMARRLEQMASLVDEDETLDAVEDMK